MDWSHHVASLRILDEVVRAKSIAAAGRHLGISQQAVSARMQSMERQLGVELLIRSSTGIRPTPEGETVLAWGAEVLEAVDRFSASLELLRGAPSRELRVAASQTIAAHLLPDWIMHLRRRRIDEGHESVSTQLRTGNSTQVVEMLREGEIHLGFIETPAIPSGLGSTTVAVDCLIPVVSPGHELAARPSVTFEALARTALVAREEGSGTRDGWEIAVRRALHVDPEPPCLVLSTTAAVRSAVKEGIAPAVISELAVMDDIQLGRLRPLEIEGLRLERPLTAVWRGSASDLHGASRELVEVAHARGLAGA